MEVVERYGIIDAHYFCNSAIFDTKINEVLNLYQICDLLNQLDKSYTRCAVKYSLSVDKNEELKQKHENVMKKLEIENLLLYRTLKTCYDAYSTLAHITNQGIPSLNDLIDLCTDTVESDIDLYLLKKAHGLLKIYKRKQKTYSKKQPKS